MRLFTDTVWRVRRNLIDGLLREECNLILDAATGKEMGKLLSVGLRSGQMGKA